MFVLFCKKKKKKHTDGRGALGGGGGGGGGRPVMRFTAQGSHVPALRVYEFSPLLSINGPRSPFRRNLHLSDASGGQVFGVHEIADVTPSSGEGEEGLERRNRFLVFCPDTQLHT